MRFPRNDWDNQCSIFKKDVNTVDGCKTACIDDDGCMQYMFDPKLSECKTSNGPKYGEASLGSGLYSDWIFDRIEKWRDNQPSCLGESFSLLW